ncbi:beta-ketoacyl [acyl carrier protein] synthase domain-containing protein [Saccharothrix algeriensis]|uniref:Acyl transferase domain-containing protein n=1 Tax=Saccharothrix algeriensis TaxID=173560 RepID=A0ABS2S0V1_9PSEU|nr:polyketide synthase [Saccharothrix algeriensis]MBM7809857.1 acyl transferase domain-containing protein [Saccharothrix algeriensis]
MSAAGAAPVAVVGMAARVPGADDAEAFWRLLVSGARTGRPAPADRLLGYRPDLAGVADPVVSLLPDVGEFEPGLFGITPRMAAWLDPQQRLVLESAWHALESAGIAPATLAGRDVGVFVATTGADMRDRMAGLHVVDRYSAIGLLSAFTANRVSHQFDLRGPSVTVDAACAGGLTAVTQAVSGLRAGEFGTALVGSANVLLHGHMQAVMQRFGALSPTGSARCFSADADGYVRGEGVFCFVLKLLADAVSDGDPVLAVIRGCALNHDGRRGTLTRSDPGSQVELLGRALAQAGWEPAELGYVESHAAGTGKGDPIEVRAVLELLRSRPGPPAAAGPGGKLWMGSAKGGIGHLEGAAGAAGLARAVQVLRHRVIPPTPGISALHPDIPADRHPVEIASAAVPWPDGAPRRVGVTALGVGGANAHVVLEEAPVLPGAGRRRPGRWPVPVSARTANSLARLAAGLADLLTGAPPSAPPPPDFPAAVWTLQTGRAGLARRAVVAASGPREFGDAVGALARGEPHPLVFRPDDADRRRLVDVGLAAGEAAMAERWLGGAVVDWAALWPHDRRPRRVPLVAYPFDRVPCWPEEAGPLPRDRADAPREDT